MTELKDLIKQYPELGDILAEIENRLNFLENSTNHTKVTDLEKCLITLEKSPEEVPPDKTYIVEHIRSYVPLKLTERIKQLEADIDGLKKGYHTHLDKKRKPIKPYKGVDIEA